MLKQFHIRLTDRFKKPETSNRFTNGLVNILSVILYPLILLFGLVTLFFAAILSLYQKTFTNKGDNTSTENLQPSIEQWSILTEQGNLKIFSKFAGEARFGPAYLHLKSDPVIAYLTDKIFGDWFFHRDNVLFLQQWNSTGKPNTNLVAIHTLTFDIKLLEQNIPSVLWNIVETENSSLQLTCDTGHEILRYSISSS